MDFIPAKTLVNRTKDSSWFGTDYTLNIYKGCCHGCIYCDSRSECYHVENFDTVRAKDQALLLIRDELRHKVKTGVIGTGAMSDPYNPFEKQYALTRHALELIDAYSFGVALATKSPLITRDIDLLQSIKEHSPVLCKITLTTYDDALSQILEPHVAPSSERFEALEKLSQASLFVGLLMMPILPYINDTEENILSIIHEAKARGAKFIYPSFGVTLRTNQREYYYSQLDKHFPGLKEKYRKAYGSRYHCSSPRAKKLSTVFAEECHRLGLLYTMPQITAWYKKGYSSGQLSLF